MPPVSRMGNNYDPDTLFDMSNREDKSIERVEAIVCGQLRSELLGGRGTYYALRVLHERYRRRYVEHRQVSEELMRITPVTSEDLEKLIHVGAVEVNPARPDRICISSEGSRWLLHLYALNKWVTRFADVLFGSDRDIIDRFIREIRSEDRFKYLSEVIVVSPWLLDVEVVRQLYYLVRARKEEANMRFTLITRPVEGVWESERNRHNECKRLLERIADDVREVRNLHAKLYIAVAKISEVNDRSIAVITSANMTGYKNLEVAVVLDGEDPIASEMIDCLVNNTLFEIT